MYEIVYIGPVLVLGDISVSLNKIPNNILWIKLNKIIRDTLYYLTVVLRTKNKTLILVHACKNPLQFVKQKFV